MGQVPPEILRMETIASTFSVQDMHLFWVSLFQMYTIDSG